MEQDGQTNLARNGLAAERLAQVRLHTLDLLLLTTFLARLLSASLYGPGSLSARNMLYLVVTGGELLGYAILLLARRLPLRVRAWGFCLIGFLLFALYVPRGMFTVPVVSGVLSAIYAGLLLGPRTGAGFVLGILGLITASGFLPQELLTALSYGPPHPPRGDPPLIVAAGLIPLVAAPFGITIILRGLLRGFQESQGSEQRLRDVIDASPDAISLIDWESERYLDVNPSFVRTYGWPAADVVGRTPVELGVVRQEDADLLRARLTLLPELDGTELVARSRSGNVVLSQAALRRTRIGGRQVVLIITRDVTTQRRVEAAVHHAQRIEAMGTLAGGVAHNFRNALGSILPNLDYCLAEAPPALRDPLQDARTAASAAVDLAVRLTCMARQGVEAPRGLVELRGVLLDVLGICRSTFGARLTVLETIEEREAHVLADRGELHQVLLNLLLNARDATAELDAPRIQVSLSRSADGTTAVIRVADNGHGMDAETLRRLGEPFFTTKPEGQGTGLGLSTAFAAVREAGGQISVESQLGAGTTFTIELPLASSAQPARPAGTARPRLPGRSVRVLVVDDDALLLEALGRQLVSLGLETEQFMDPTEALARIRSSPRPFDILFTDLDMPVLSGRELVDRVRAVVPGLPVVILSGTPNAEPIEGAVVTLAKPVSTADLAAAVSRCLGLEEKRSA